MKGKGLISDRLWQKAGEQGFPLTAAFELLPVCNLRCEMCYVRKSMKEVEEAGGLLRADRWLDIAGQARKQGLLYPLLTGGEPLLHPDFREILSGMLQMGMQVSLNSNGTMIDRSMAKWLGQHVPTRINITIYGASEESYQKLCGNGAAYGKLRDGVQWLKEYGVPVKFNTSITPQNLQDLDEIIAYAHRVESPIQVATYMFPPFRREPSMVGKNHRLSAEEAGKARVYADYLQNEPEWFLGQASSFRHFRPLEQLELPDASGCEDGQKREMKMICRAGHASFWVDWQGNMMNCGMYGSVKIPMKDRSFADAWEELKERTHAIRYHPACAECPNRHLCHPCLAMVNNECGDWDGKPDYICRMNEASARYYREFAERYYPEEWKRLENGQMVKEKQVNPVDICEL